MKTEVYSWRVSAELKDGLRRVAKSKNLSLAEALEVAAQDWLDKQKATLESEQARLQAAMAECVGVVASGKKNRSTRVSSDLKKKLAQKYGTGSTR